MAPMTVFSSALRRCFVVSEAETTGDLSGAVQWVEAALAALTAGRFASAQRSYFRFLTHR